MRTPYKSKYAACSAVQMALGRHLQPLPRRTGTWPKNKLCGFGVGDQSIGIKPAWRRARARPDSVHAILALRFQGTHRSSLSSIFAVSTLILLDVTWLDFGLCTYISGKSALQEEGWHVGLPWHCRTCVPLPVDAILSWPTKHELRQMHIATW